jgi:alginate O-acetyltransferase complex protein AlgI
MLFNSYLFIFLFLPVTWLVWRGFVHWGGAQAGVGCLIGASLFFYAWWDWRYAPLLVLSLLVNYGVGRRLIAAAGAPSRRGWLALGLAWNLGLLGFCKYWDFFIRNANALTDAGLPLLHVVLPLGISFFTFQKIAFLLDANAGGIRSVRLRDFSLFVVFFPQLIAGPIVHHRDFIPQLHDPEFGRIYARRLALGLTLFSAGLFQKSFVADALAPLADSAFGLAANGPMLRCQEAWLGLLAYSFQLFYDFSGYSHMALGLALLFGLRLPVNFLAPYTAGSLIEFWRRWHITLSAFLRDYVYIPLGGNRGSRPRVLLNLFLTLLVGGIWHGAGWTFVLWGAWHGVGIGLNHLWQLRRAPAAAMPRGWARLLTLGVVLPGWCLFRAPDLVTAQNFAESLLGFHGFTVPVAWLSWVQPLAPVVRARGWLPNLAATPFALVVLVVAGWLACFGPRLLRWFGATAGDVTATPAWQAAELAPPHATLTWRQAVAAGLMLSLAVAALSRSAPFLYFQF